MDNLAYKLGSRAVSNRYRTNQNDKVRVCFYGRVSTQHEAQINALDNQWCCIIKVDTLFSRILIYNHNQYENRRKTYGTESKIL